MHEHPSSSSHQSFHATSAPFLRWAGGKQRLLNQLLPLLPGGPRLIEPFVGAGSVFLGSSYASAVLNDANPDLVAVWVALRDRPSQFIAAASELFTESNRSVEAYRRIREEFNQSSDRFDRAVRFIYLNRFGFNGLFRVNQRGNYNVPYGRPAVLPGFPRERMRLASEKLSQCIVINGGFAHAMELATAGDVVYCDPPYSSSSQGSSFSGYTMEGFTTENHLALVQAARRAVGRGATVLISNHDTPVTRDLYREWCVHSLSVRRSVSAKQSARRSASELLAVLSDPADASQVWDAQSSIGARPEKRTSESDNRG